MAWLTSELPSERAHVIEAPAHVHHQALAILIGDGLHPGEGIEHGGRIHQEGAEKELRPEGHSAIRQARPTSPGDARHVAAMGGVAVDVRGVRLNGQQVLGGGELRSIAIGGRCRTGLPVMVPCGTHTRGGEQGIVEHRVGVVEAPVGDADQHILAGVCLWQVDAPVHTIGPNGLDQPVQVGFHLAGEFDVGKAAQLLQAIQVVDVDPEGAHGAHPSSPEHLFSFQRTGPFLLTAQEADHAAPVHVGRGISALGQFRDLERVLLLTREGLQIQEIGAGGSRNGRLGMRKRCGQNGEGGDQVTHGLERMAEGT